MANATAHPRVYLLADHLDAILSCGEDLLSTPPLSVSDETASTVSSPNDRRSFVETMRTLEVRIVSRVLMARDLADAVRRTDRRFTPMADMFQSGTVPLADAAAELADSTGPDFLTGNDAIAYLRNRRNLPWPSAHIGRCGAAHCSDASREVGSIAAASPSRPTPAFGRNAAGLSWLMVGTLDTTGPAALGPRGLQRRGRKRRSR